MGRQGFLSASLLCLLLTAAGRPAAAQDYFGAIAYSPSTRAHGWTYDYGSRREAQNVALAECRRHADDCVVAVWFRNACGALAVGLDGYGAGWEANQVKAERSALKLCRRYSEDCRILRSICSSP